MSYEMKSAVHLLLRWAHVFFVILWIGQTHMFAWMDHLFHGIRNGEAEEGTPEKLRLIHSGGFYIVDKVKVPGVDTKFIHWFRLEATMSWITGMLLLILVYYDGGALVDSNVYEMSDGTASMASLGVLFGGFVVYSLLCNSPLASNVPVLTAVLFGAVCATSYGLHQLFSARGAWIHMGVLFGTIMAFNVFMVIIPGQKRMIAALERGEDPPEEDAKKAKLRSTHNGFLVMPVMAIMISNHFPVAYGHKHNWIILSGLVLFGWILGIWKNRI